MKTVCVFLLVFGIFFLVYPLQGASVFPIPSLGNPDCNSLCLCSGCYSELKVDPPQEGSFSDSVLTVTISNATYKPDDGGDDDENEMMSFDWSANIGVNVVIVKAGNCANIYVYEPAATSDTHLVPPGIHAISHITFCYVPPQLEVSVSGLKNLTIDQPSIGYWSSTGNFSPLIGDPSDGSGLTVSVQATSTYSIYISYSYSIHPAGSLPSPEEPLSYEYPAGTWYTIPKYPTMATLHGFSGTAGTETHVYPVAVDLTKLGDRTAGDTITFTIHVMVTQQ